MFQLLDRMTASFGKLTGWILFIVGSLIPIEQIELKTVLLAAARALP